MKIKCFQSPEEVVKQLSADFHEMILDLASTKETICIAVSGGTTPEMFFNDLADTHDITGKTFPWEKVHMFWVDERCVPPDNTQSNYGMVHRKFLSRLNPCRINIHRIKGEAEPYREAERYSKEILKYVKRENEFPVFDWIMLGVGEDGHTASLFPDRPDLLHSPAICEAVKHPATGQFRITLTGGTILHTKRLIFLVTGKSKSEIIRQIFQHVPEAEHYPAAQIQTEFSDATWYIDQAAGIHLNISCRDKH